MILKSHIILCFGKNPCRKKQISNKSMEYGLWRPGRHMDGNRVSQVIWWTVPSGWGLGAVHSPLLSQTPSTLPAALSQMSDHLGSAAVGWKRSCWVKTHWARAAGLVLGTVFSASFHFRYMYFNCICVHMQTWTCTPGNWDTRLQCQVWFLQGTHIQRGAEAMWKGMLPKFCSALSSVQLGSPGAENHVSEIQAISKWLHRSRNFVSPHVVREW